MAKAIVVTSGKGGVGKSTLCVLLGAHLARMGRKVLLLDADIGLRNLDVMLGLQDKIVYDIVDVIEGTCRLKQALIRDRALEGLTLLPAAQLRDQAAVTPDAMRELMPRLKKQFDIILIDCPAGVGRGFRNAVAAADSALIVTTLDYAALRDAQRTAALLHRADVRGAQLIINRARKSSLKLIPAAQAESFVGARLAGVVPEDGMITTLAAQMRLAAPGKSRAAAAVQDIALRIADEPWAGLGVALAGPEGGDSAGRTSDASGALGVWPPSAADAEPRVPATVDELLSAGGQRGQGRRKHWLLNLLFSRKKGKNYAEAE